MKKQNRPKIYLLRKGYALVVQESAIRYGSAGQFLKTEDQKDIRSSQIKNKNERKFWEKTLYWRPILIREGHKCKQMQH